MKKIYLVFVDTKDGKYFAHSETFNAGTDICIKRYPLTQNIHFCESATQAAYLAEEWNQDFKNNDTFMY